MFFIFFYFFFYYLFIILHTRRWECINRAVLPYAGRSRNRIFPRIRRKRLYLDLSLSLSLSLICPSFFDLFALLLHQSVRRGSRIINNNNVIRCGQHVTTTRNTTRAADDGIIIMNTAVNFMKIKIKKIFPTDSKMHKMHNGFIPSLRPRFLAFPGGGQIFLSTKIV